MAEETRAVATVTSTRIFWQSPVEAVTPIVHGFEVAERRVKEWRRRAVRPGHASVLSLQGNNQRLKLHLRVVFPWASPSFGAHTSSIRPARHRSGLGGYSLHFGNLGSLFCFELPVLFGMFTLLSIRFVCTYP